ncbi:MAG: ROK family protein [Lentisphaerae bacterium]|jgi:predicted NBD/HSP70 family sugar kinase|nr:ROK family protein [Lentisphaerota bacterium]
MACKCGSNCECNEFFAPLEALDMISSHIDSRPDKVAIAWEREDGKVYRYDLEIPSSLKPSAVKFVSYVVERIAKFIVWSAGGWKLYLAGPEKIVKPVAKAYTKKGARAFDYDFFSSIYGRPVEAVIVPYKKMPETNETLQKVKTVADGCRIGFDLGASDFKISALKNGDVVFSKEFPWDPRNNPDPEYHYNMLTAGLKEAAASLPRVDAIGGSTAGTLVGQKMGIASLFRAVKEQNPSKFETAQNMFFRIEKDWGVPFAIYNDGDVTALAGMITMGKKGILGVAMGSSEAVGYVDPDGAMTGRISELAFAPVDFNPNAPKDEWSGDAGVGAMAFSQQAVNWLAEKYGFKFPKAMKLPERLKVVQAAMEKGDEKALKVYIQIGRFLAHAIPWYNEFYDYENMMILGRVTSGLGGSVILETAKAMLKDIYPAHAERIDIFMPDEKARRLGQSVAAAQIPVIAKKAACKRCKTAKKGSK